MFQEAASETETQGVAISSLELAASFLLSIPRAFEFCHGDGRHCENNLLFACIMASCYEEMRP